MKTTNSHSRFFALLLLIASLFLISTNAFAFNYTISFTGSGASTTVDNVIVQNLTKGTTVTVPAGNTLSLTDQNTAVSMLNTDNESVSIYPNPIQSTATFTFTAANEGSTQIRAYMPDGKKVLDLTTHLHKGRNAFQLAFPAGVYTLQVQGNGYRYTAKAISQATTACQPQISFAGIVSETKPQKAKASTAGTTTMTYTLGDLLLYKGTSGNYATVLTDKPISDKTTNFAFAECKDADNNNYSVITIGTQTWMVENLKTTKYRNGETIATTTSTSIPNDATSKYQWVYNNLESNVAIYGRFYTWYAATDTRSIAPTGWHVPTEAEWTTLENYLIANGYNYDGTTTGNKIAMSLAATTGWNSDTSTGAIGNDLSINNSSGFSALGAGYRSTDGSFNNAGYWGLLWSASASRATTDAREMRLFYNNNNSSRGDSYRNAGYSVRCVKDIPTIAEQPLSLWMYLIKEKRIALVVGICYPNCM